jgi:hypothetical protein
MENDSSKENWLCCVLKRCCIHCQFASSFILTTPAPHELVVANERLPILWFRVCCRCINLWTTFKKKPACCVQAAHRRRKHVATNGGAESEGDESSDEQDNAENAELMYALTKVWFLLVTCWPLCLSWRRMAVVSE